MKIKLLFLAVPLALVYSAAPAWADPISGTIAFIAGTVSGSVAVGLPLVQTAVLFLTEGLLYTGLSLGLSYVVPPREGIPYSGDEQ